jgi:hypothetical protein
MKPVLGLFAALAAHLALQAAQVWWVLAACQPLLLVIVSAARKTSATNTAWIGLGIGLCTDLLNGRIVGPGGIAGAATGAIVSLVVRRFELEGPLFWIIGSLAVASTSESLWFVLGMTLGIIPDHGWLGVLATVSMTSALGLVVATGERALLAWRSPERARRRMLKRL